MGAEFIKIHDGGGSVYLPLVARVRAVLRRSESPAPQRWIRVGGIEIDSGSMTVKVDGAAVAITVREFRLLQFMARNRGRVFTRDQLLDAVWTQASYVTPRSVDVYIRRLREKIERVPDDPRYLKTVHGAGYRFDGRNRAFPLGPKEFPDWTRRRDSRRAALACPAR